ncbi:MAG: glycoside hydrolase family 66 protein, partial [Verrucomicrobiota bacterium]
VYTDKAMYPPGSTINIYVTSTNSSGAAAAGTLNIVITHLGDGIASLASQPTASIAAGQSGTNTFTWTAPGADYQGYLVQVTITNGASVTGTSSSAIDVSSDWSRFPRYGYVSKFTAGISGSSVISQLNKYHLNGLQFYDWQWKHHIPYNSATSWPDIANRTNDAAVVNDLIVSAHARNMVAMNYNLYGGAYSDYQTDGSGVTLSMGIFSTASASLSTQIGYPLPGGWATSQLYSMNNRDSGWQNYIFSRELDVFSHFAFDGWQIDSLAQHNVYDYSGQYFNMDDYNSAFINNAKAYLGKRMIFNTVDAVGETQVATSANVDFVYSELWAGNQNYIDLKTRVDAVRSCGSKALVTPAYMNSNVPTGGTFKSASVRLADAAIFASGGYHLELGDNNQMLNAQYFPDNTVAMSTSLKTALRTYYDFLVAYENILRGDTVSSTNAFSLTGSGYTTSTNGAAGSVWTISKKTPGANIVHLINLANGTSNLWGDANGTYASPSTYTSLPAKMYYHGNIQGGRLWYATPDANAAQAIQLSFTTGADSGGSYVTFTIPRLQYWDMLWLELNGVTSASTQTLGQNYDTIAGTGLQATTDIGGGASAVAFVVNLNGDSYVGFNNIDFSSNPSRINVRVASAVDNASIEFHLDSPTGQIISTASVPNTGGWQTWTTASAPVTATSGTHQLFAVFKGERSNLNWFQFNAIPNPWSDQDIGTVGLTGGAAHASGTFTVNGSGWDIWLDNDAFHYVSQPLTGDGAILARVLSQTNTNAWAKAGVMLRSSGSAGASNAFMALTSSNGLFFQSRTADGGTTASTGAAGIAAPTWLRVVWSGNTATGYQSADGSTWTQVGSATLSSSMTLI